ncbi:MAG: hypothetical protein JKY61_05485 [Planctomycetes bacterium]|nr:hypothetical protein [Planctomycetota bacterium]
MGDRQLHKKPAEGHLRVQVLNGEGEPFAGSVRGFANGKGWTSEGSSEGGAVIVIRRIPLGHSFSLCVSGGGEWKRVELDFEGLSEDSEGRSVSVTMNERAPVFVGRVRCAFGKPLGNLAVRMEMKREHRGPFIMASKIDVNHRFRFLPKGALADRVTVWARVGGSWLDQIGEEWVPPADAQNVHDFGNVRLALAPVELAGHVCFPDGTPASGVHLEWAYDWTRTPDEATQHAERKASLKPLSRCAVGKLRALGLKPAGRRTTATDGSFRVLGLKSNLKAFFGTQQPHVCKAGTFLLPRETSSFSTEEESKLTLLHAASLKGTVAIEGNRTIDIFVDYPDGFRFLVGTVTGPNPEFSHAALYPGTVELTAVDAETGEALASLSTLSLVPGVQTRVSF